MIGRLVGHLVSDEVDTVVLDVNGVGYELTVPLGTLGRAIRHDDGRVVLVVHTLAREDALILYGFGTEADRAAFRMLIAVSNVGPKTALAVLSALPAEDLARALAAKDAASLARLPGIGKKTAERLVLELKDKLVSTLGTAAAAPSLKAAASAAPSPAELLVGALVRMGFKQAEVERTVAAMGEKASGPMPEAIREALAILSA